jgi:ABC-type Fe3+/spermidine/putrescine transport system ATPase subunit
LVGGSVPDALELRSLSVTYAATVALAGVDLRVAHGEVLALLGPSGSGKSTLLNAVAGFVTPTRGEIVLNGERVAGPRVSVAPERRSVAFVFQNYALWPHLSALDTVAYPIRRRGVPRTAARAEALRILERLQVGQLADRLPAQLSGGEQQRVGLARAMARRAGLYLFDEPTAHLDAAVRSVFLTELAARRRESGAAAVYATHDAEEALGLADRVALLVGGRVIQVGSPAQVYAEPVRGQAARLTGPVSVLAGPGGPLAVRPDWARLDGDRSGVVADVWFRGPHADYALHTELGRLLVRSSGPPVHAPGDRVSWSLDRSWPLPEGARP